MRPDCRCLILAAGKGTRLLPLTQKIPKPLFPVLDMPALDRLVLKLRSEGIDEIAVNCHHLTEKMETWKTVSPCGKHVTLLKEEVLLDTGGAIKNLFEKLGYDRPLLVYNADIISNLSITSLFREFTKRSGALALLCLHSNPLFNKIRCKFSKIISFKGKGKDLLAYTGIAIFRPECFKEAPSTPFPLIPFIQQLIDKGTEIGACRAEEIARDEKWMWQDIGTPRGYLEANFGLLAIKGQDRLLNSDCVSDTVRLAKRVIIGRDARLSGTLSLKNVVVWPKTSLNMDGEIKDAIVTPFGILKA